MLATLAHTVGWPIPVGGSQAIPDALIADIRAHGGTITASRSKSPQPPNGVVLFDTAPTALLNIYRNRVPARYAKALQRYRFGPGVAKVDFVLSEEIPWARSRGRPRHPPSIWGAPASRWHRPSVTWPRAGTRSGHGTPRRRSASGGPGPHRRAGPPSAVDLRACPRRVPRRPNRNGHRGFRAFRSRVFATSWWRCARYPQSRLADHNANLVGGDIGVGGNTLLHALAGLDAAAQPVGPRQSRRCTCVRRRRRRAAACTAWRVTTPRARCWPRIRHQEAAIPRPLTRCRRGSQGASVASPAGGAAGPMGRRHPQSRDAVQQARRCGRWRGLLLGLLGLLDRRSGALAHVPRCDNPPGLLAALAVSVEPVVFPYEATCNAVIHSRGARVECPDIPFSGRGARRCGVSEHAAGQCGRGRNRNGEREATPVDGCMGWHGCPLLSAHVAWTQIPESGGRSPE